MSFLSNLESNLEANVAHTVEHSVAQAAAPVVQAASAAVASAVSDGIKVAAQRLQTYLAATQANYANVLSNIRALEKQEASYEAAIQSVQQQLSALAKEAGTDVATLVKSLG